jgi:cytochrome c oxidase subunit 4
MKPPSPIMLVATWMALLVLLAATFALAHVPLGGWNTATALAIAVAKALLVALVFMQLRGSSALVALFAAAGIAWLAILFGLSAADYATRVESPAPYSTRGDP